MSDNSFLSSIRILDSKVVSFDLYTNPDYEGEVGDPVLGLSVHLTFIESDGDSLLCQGAVDAGSTWLAADNEEVESHHAKCCLGILISAPKDSFSSETSNDERELIMKATALSIAYSKIRVLIEGLTAQSIHGIITLPAIEPLAFLENLMLLEDEK